MNMKNIFLEKYSLSGKTALITGAAGLLGHQHSLALLECGANVILCDLNIEKFEPHLLEIEALKLSSDQFLFREMDVTKHEDIMRLAIELEVESRMVDILVNNAAIDPKVEGVGGIKESTRLENFPLDRWDAQIAVGLTGAFLCSQVFGSRMASSGRGGVILNIASDLSVISPDQRIYRKNSLTKEMQPVKPVTYSVIKTGLIGLTRYLATYWADQGVRCNALSPGGVYAGQDDEFVSRLTSLIPIGRMANHDEYRSAIQFLCSDASAYMNGQNIVMDGGRSVW